MLATSCEIHARVPAEGLGSAGVSLAEVGSLSVKEGVVSVLTVFMVVALMILNKYRKKHPQPVSRAL